MSTESIAALEIGTSEVRVVVAEVREDQHLMVTGLGQVPSRGVRKSEIVDFDTVVACVKAAIHEAEENADVVINQLFLTFSGGHIQQLVNRGTIPILAPNEVITGEDIQDVMNNARTVNLSPDREILHSICRHFYVDDQPGVVSPEGMVGTRLSLDMLLLHCVENRLRNMVRIADECQVDVADAAFGGLCSALAVLTQQQKEGGAVVIDLGAGSTDYVVYSNKAIACAGSIAVGGDHVTNDLSIGLNLPTALAEKVKRKHGSAMIDLGSRDRKIHVPSEAGFSGKDVLVRDVNTIIHARMKEIFELIRDRLKHEAMREQFSAGVTLTGGGSYMDRVGELASRTFEMPSHTGHPKGVSGLSLPTEAPEFAAVVGMLKYGMRGQNSAAKRGTLGAYVKALFGK